jgi:hypothetical protein
LFFSPLLILSAISDQAASRANRDVRVAASGTPRSQFL